MTCDELHTTVTSIEMTCYDSGIKGDLRILMAMIAKIDTSSTTVPDETSGDQMTVFELVRRLYEVAEKARYVFDRDRLIDLACHLEKESLEVS